MELNFWERNCDVLKKHYPALLKDIISDEDRALAQAEPAPNELANEGSFPDIKIEISTKGDPTICFKGVFVHSKHDPAREGQRLAETVAPNANPVVILGFGLGYSAEAAAAVKHNRIIIIVEKYKELFLKALELRDFSGFLANNRIIFILGGTGEGITGALDIAENALLKERSDSSEPAVIRSRALCDLDEKWYKAVEEKIRTYKMKDKVNAATLNRFGRRWVQNLFSNKTAVRDFAGISRLAGLAAAEDAAPLGETSLPVFLAAAGPSLDKIRPLLGEIRRRCIVVAVDTSLRFFVNNGTSPDFVLVVDPQFWNSRHLDRCVDEQVRAKTALIAESAVYPPVLRLHFKNIFLCGSLFPFGEFIESRVDPKGKLGAGGSVATTAWDFARSLGGREIWIAGLDLSFPGLKTHFRGALFEDRANAASNRFNPAETWVVRALRDGLPFKAPSAAGKEVLTDRRLSLYAAWFENRFRQYPEVNSFALFQEGLEIAGLQSASAETFLSLPDRRDEIDRRLKTVFTKIENDFNNSAEKQKRAERYDNAVSLLTRGLESIKKAAEEGTKITSEAMRRSVTPDRQKKILKDLDYITRRVTDSEVKEVAGFLLPTIEDAEADSAVQDPFRVYLKSSFKLFSGLLNTLDFYLKNDC